MDTKRSARAKCLALLLAMYFAAPCGLLARYQPSTGADSYSTEQEIQIGQQAEAQTMQKMPILPDSSPISQYISRLGQELAAQAPGYRWPYRYHVVNTKDINAFALPGGPIFVNLGTIQAADTEAQLAGVLAHETSHVVERHATRAATKEAKYQVGLGILGALLGARGIGGALAAQGAKFAVGSYFLHNSRQNEQEADLVGTDIMYDAGFNPIGLAQFFQKLEKLAGPGGPQMLSDHPDPGNRYAAVEQEISTLPPKSSYRTDSAEFLRIKQLVGGMHPGTEQESASEERGRSSGQDIPSDSGANRPSGSFQQLQHNNFTIEYPSNWQVLGDVRSDITIAPSAGLGQNQQGQSAVSYGVMISTFEGEQRGGSALDDETHQLIDQLHQGNPAMRQSGSEEDIRVNGEPGKSIEFTGDSPIPGQTERDWLVTVGRSDGRISYLIFIAPTRDFNGLRPAFEQMLRTFHLR